MNRDRGFHPVNTGHLVMGVAFAGLFTVWALVAADAVSTDDVRWLLPLPWLFAGGLGLLAFLVSRSRRRPRPELPAADPAATSYDAEPDTETTGTTGTTGTTEDPAGTDR